MRPNTHGRLVKPLIWRDGPDGVYPGKLFWMEGSKDMEGFGASFSYAFVTKECVLFPQDGALVHPFDTALAFVGIDTDDILDLHATVSIEIGVERETYTFNESKIVSIPKGTQYGNVRVSDISGKGFVEYSVYLAPEYSYMIVPQNELKEPVHGRKYKDFIQPYVWTLDQKTNKVKGDLVGDMGVDGDGSGMGYERSADDRGVAHPHDAEGPGGMGPGNADTLLWVFGEDMQGFELNTLWGHYSRPGIWHRGGESHTHPNEELLIPVSIDPDDPFNIGAEVEMAMGDSDERYPVTAPSVYICPKNFSHLPEITRWADRPYGFTIINLDGSHESPWKGRDE